MSLFKNSLKRSILFVLVLAASLQGLVHAEIATGVEGAGEQPKIEYLLGPDDQIKMTVFGEEELSGVYAVSAVGTLSIPLIGDVRASGRTLKQLEAEIVEKFRGGYLVDPSVALEVAKYRPFYILGEVRLPGSYSYVSGINVLNAVALAGGFTYRANKKRIQIRRAGPNGNDVVEEKPIEYKIQPGDVILVRERFF